MTDSLDDAREAIAKDPNYWWRLETGDMQNLFDAACDEIDELGEALHNVLHRLHRTHGNTAGPRGGVGGQSLTSFCHVISPYSEEDLIMAEKAEVVLLRWARAKTSVEKAGT
jgi:hypothetical protein